MYYIPQLSYRFPVTDIFGLRSCVAVFTSDTEHYGFLVSDGVVVKSHKLTQINLQICNCGMVS